MLAILGWLLLIVIGVQLSIVWFLLLVNNSGKWTIGGAANSLSTRILVLVAGLLIAFYWHWVYTMSPLTITLNT